MPCSGTHWYTMPFNGHAFLSFACRITPCNIAELGKAIFWGDFHIATSSRASKRSRAARSVGEVLCGRRHSVSPISRIAFSYQEPDRKRFKEGLPCPAKHRDALGAHLKRLVPQTLETSIHFNGTTEPQLLYAVLDSKNGCHYYNL